MINNLQTNIEKIKTTIKEKQHNFKVQKTALAITSILLTAPLALTGCGGNKKNDAPTPTPTPATSYQQNGYSPYIKDQNPTPPPVYEPHDNSADSMNTYDTPHKEDEEYDFSAGSTTNMTR